MTHSRHIHTPLSTTQWYRRLVQCVGAHKELEVKISLILIDLFCLRAV